MIAPVLLKFIRHAEEMRFISLILNLFNKFNHLGSQMLDTHTNNDRHILKYFEIDFGMKIQDSARLYIYTQKNN